MNNIDKKWLEKCMAAPSKYTIYVDNDCISVDDVKKDENVHTFSEYGHEFALQLLRQIGCNATNA